MMISTVRKSEKENIMAAMKKRVGLASLFVLLCSAGSGAQSLGSITLTQVVPRVITPNGDLLNDVAFFKFDDSVTGLPVDGAIFDTSGAKISTLVVTSAGTALTWNGRDDAGRIVPSGIYFYSIKIGKNAATGTLVVAR